MQKRVKSSVGSPEFAQLRVKAEAEGHQGSGGDTFVVSAFTVHGAVEAVKILFRHSSHKLAGDTAGSRVLL